MRYHPIDIETSVLRSHRSICECAVFTWTNLLVVVVELDGSENEALDLIPLVTNVVLEEHYLIVGQYRHCGRNGCDVMVGVFKAKHGDNAGSV